MSEDAYRVDRRAMRRAFSQASGEYDQYAVLQAEVRSRLLERLELFKVEPSVVLDLGSGTGHASAALHQRYPQAQVVAMDAALGMLQQARTLQGGWFGLRRKRFTSVCADAYRLPFKDASVDMVVSNLMLQWCDPLDGVFAEVRRVLKPGGVFSFASFGPDTLRELREAWAAVDDHVHVNRFIDMHDVGDALMRAGLTEPVLDVEHLTLTYQDAMTLMRELKAIGAHNVAAGRRPGLTGREALKQMTQAYESQRRDGVLPASYEVVYGHAWGSDQPMDKSSRGLESEVLIPINRIGRRS